MTYTIFVAFVVLTWAVAVLGVHCWSLDRRIKNHRNYAWRCLESHAEALDEHSAEIDELRSALAASRSALRETIERN